MRNTGPRIFRYVVATDRGTAPQPFGGFCTLAICKPKIRASAIVGDWVVGFRSKRPGEVIYAMQVAERLRFADYWQDPRFRKRRPGLAGDYPDNIYRPRREGGLEQVPNQIHHADHVVRDLSGKHVLVADRFWYFGRNSVPIPNELLHLVHGHIGHAVDKDRKADDVETLQHWLAAWPIGVHGRPIDAPALDVAAEGKTRSCGSTPEPKAARPSGRVCAPPGRPRSRLQDAPKRIVLSRKGFDSGYGGHASPILPDGRLVALPIPARHDTTTLADLSSENLDVGALVSDLSRGRLGPATTVHLDPDLDRPRHLRLPGWRPALGQSQAAQSHLAAQGVGRSDVFLFFGWFREVERTEGRWRFARGAPNLHVLFGWLEVGEVVDIIASRDDALRQHPWIWNHPHVANPAHYADPRNTLYLATQKSAFRRGVGGGAFPHFQPGLQLTAPGGTRTQWRLPAWLHPGDTRPPLSYHGDPGRWAQRCDEWCELSSVAKGQEFVLQAGQYPESTGWLASLIGSGAGPG